MRNLGFVYELYMFLIFKNCLVSFSKETLLFLAWVTDEIIVQGYFIDYTNIYCVIFSYAFN